MARPRQDRESVRTGEGEQPLGRILSTLAEPQARYVLYCLAAVESGTSRDRLADAVTGLEASADGTVATPADRRRVSARLHHVSLPALEDAGLVAVDPATDTVTQTAASPVIDALLDLGD